MDEPASLALPSGLKLAVRSAEPSDVPAVTRLIHDAFSVWAARGLSLSPMRQDDDETRRHLVGKGFVALNALGEIVGTFSLEQGRVAARRAGRLDFLEEGGEAVPFAAFDDAGDPPLGKLLVFKKAAVRPDLARAGLGVRLHRLAEASARESACAGMVLETVREADWLYAWYVKLGYRPIGACRYPGAAVDTVLMIKEFGRRGG